MKKALTGFLNKLIEILIYKQKQIEIAHLRYQPGVNLHPGFYVGPGTFFRCEKGIRELRIDEGVVARNHCNFKMYPGSTLIIHPQVFINNYCSFNCLGHIEIGAGTLFGEGVKLYDHNHTHTRDAEGNLSIGRDEFKIGSIKIGANCWIGSNVTILNNVQIGDNVIIGAGCLIHKSVPANTIVRADAPLSYTGKPDPDPSA